MFNIKAIYSPTTILVIVPRKQKIQEQKQMKNEYTNHGNKCIMCNFDKIVIKFFFAINFLLINKVDVI